MPDQILDPTNTEEREDAVNPLSISDEDFLNMEIPAEPTDELNTDTSKETDDPTATDPTATDIGVVDDPAGKPNGDDSLGADPSLSGGITPNGENSQETAGSSEASAQDPEKVDPNTDPNADLGSDPDKQPADATVDYKAAYEKLTAPFKANGVDIQVRNIEEAISLMQMGANYHKKMATLKPALQTVRMLEKHGLNDVSKLQFLVDLNNKDPQAIQKLLKESEIDPVDLNLSEDVNYIPKAQTVSDAEMQLDDVLESIQATPTFARTIDVVTKEWDIPSRKIIADNPNIIAVLNGQMESGIYDKVMGEVTRARALGHLKGISDLDAYKQMGDYMHNQGAFTPAAEATPPVNVAQDKAQQQQQETERQARRKAAGSPSTKKAATPQKPVTNILAMPDEDFEKLPPEAFVMAK